MSVMDEGIIDFTGLEKTEIDKNNLALTIFDHLCWGEETDDVHLLMLQNKINSYLQYIEGGRVNEHYKLGNYDKIIIRIIAKYPFSSDCTNFLNMSKQVINGAGFELEWEISLFKNEGN